MISISRTGDMKADLIGVLKIKGVDASVFNYYGIVSTSGEKFSAYTLQECQIIADKLAEDTVIVANGISCRAQIEHGLGRKARHMVQVLADAMGH